jgi:uncharacterized protein YneF (UPF0154 family)
MNFCGECGNKLKAEHKFCSGCGIKLISKEKIDEPDSVNPNKEKKSEQFTEDSQSISEENIESQSLKIDSSKEEKKSSNQKEDYIKKLKNFDRKQPLYQPIRWTLISLIWIEYFGLFIAQEGQVIDGLRTRINAPALFTGVAITFLITRTIMRYQFIKNPSFNNKIVITVGVFIGIFLIQQFIGILLTSEI